MKNWMDTAVSTLLRTGVLLSITIVAAGMVITFLHHPDYVSSRSALARLTAPGTHSPSTIGEVIAGVRRGSGQAFVMAGLLVLIATPVARVLISIVSFAVERDRLYVAITAVVFVVLMISFAVGSA
ncbi:MAG TPA: DUF1634 domain-containing protein [Thermoanaerobaculia bacterium]|nr:DUF1634 domain-containing protein [Thermoanaerobaculia bacterium]